MVGCVVGVLTFSFLWGYSAYAASNSCGPRSMVIERLARVYQEAVKAVATTGTLYNAAIVEVYVSKQRSFSIVTTSRFGISCLRMAGANWDDVEWKPGEEL